MEKLWNRIWVTVHGAQIKNAKCSKFCQNFITNTIETSNTAMEQEFCDIIANNFKNWENSSYEAQLSIFWQMAESANKPLMGYG